MGSVEGRFSGKRWSLPIVHLCPSPISDQRSNLPTVRANNPKFSGHWLENIHSVSIPPASVSHLPEECRPLGAAGPHGGCGPAPEAACPSLPVQSTALHPW